MHSILEGSHKLPMSGSEPRKIKNLAPALNYPKSSKECLCEASTISLFSGPCRNLCLSDRSENSSLPEIRR